MLSRLRLRSGSRQTLLIEMSISVAFNRLLRCPSRRLSDRRVEASAQHFYRGRLSQELALRFVPAQLLGEPALLGYVQGEQKP